MVITDTIQISAGRIAGPKTTRVNTVCIDADNTIFAFEPKYIWQKKVGEPDPEAVHLIKMLQSLGYNVVVLTARGDRTPVEDGLKALGLTCEVTNVKPPAIAYVDDRGITWRKGDSTAQNVLTLIKLYGKEWQ